MPDRRTGGLRAEPKLEITPEMIRARKIRLLEVSSGMIAAGVAELDRLGLTISAQEASDTVAILWSVVEAQRRQEILGCYPSLSEQANKGGFEVE